MLPLSNSAGAVAVARGPMSYDAPPPYSPARAYPEYPHRRADGTASSSPRTSATVCTDVYDAVRESLFLLGLDAARFDTPGWNPLGTFVQPDDTVVLKPNFVREFRDTRPGHDDCLVTHGAVIRPVLDYVYIALQGKGRIVIADASHNDANFDAVCSIVQTRAIQDFYLKNAGFNLEVIDLRPEEAIKVDGVIVGHRPLPGDPAGYVRVNLGPRSMFAPINDLCRLLYGSEYDTRELHSHQHDDVHEYLISKTVLQADCVISLPKLKTHKKTGLTVNMKNLVGINGNKNWLPHHREGTPSQGGDQFNDDGVKNRLERSTVAKFKRVFPFLGPLRPLVAGPIKAVGKRLFGDTSVNRIRSGNWHGNDTTWRMVIDLNRILYYADADGRLHDAPVRKLFSVVDGIIGGEGNGPMDPTAKPAGIIAAGCNPVTVDCACARLMGLDFARLPVLRHCFDEHALPLVNVPYDRIALRSNHPQYAGAIGALSGRMLAFKPHFGWVGHVEAGEERHEARVVG